MARSILASSSPISSMRSSMSATAPAPPPPFPGESERMPFFPATGTNAAPNPATFVKALDPPKYGFDRYVEEKLASAGGRTLKGKGSKGNIYTSGHFKGKTQGQAIEMMRAAYAGMSDEARAPFEAGANGRDVMSATEQATLARHDLARGVAAGGGMGQNLPAQSPATPRGISASPVMATPPPVTAPPSQQAGAIVSAAESAGSSPRGIFENGPDGKVRAERQADGTIKRTPVQAPAQAPAPQIPMPRAITPGLPATPAGAAGEIIQGAEKAMGPEEQNTRLRRDLSEAWQRGDAAARFGAAGTGRARALEVNGNPAAGIRVRDLATNK
jgi:hypothetical protein